MALTERYVTTTGAGAHDGTSEADAWSLSEAIANAAAGHRVNIKANATYTLSGAITFATNGTIGAPIVWRGYTTTIGDAAAAYNSDGSLDVTNMPTISASDATYTVTVSGNYNVFQDTVFSLVSATAGVSVSGAGSCIQNCKVTNTNTDASSHALAVTGTQAAATRCDVTHAGASGGGGAVQTSGDSLLFDCRLTSTSGPGVITASGETTVVGCIIYSCGTRGIRSTATGASAHVRVLGTTIYGCASSGVSTVAGFTASVTVVGCHITDCGAYAVNGNGATALFAVHGNRFRDNASGHLNIDAEWNDAAALNITTDGGDHTTDYEDATSLDFRLIRTAPGLDTSARGRNRGACGNDYPEASSSGGGGRRLVFIKGR